MFGFPVPVSNQSIPRGWFAALVRFMNSLLLRGDGRYFAVTHTTEGTTIKPTPALIQALERSGGAAPSAGGSGTTYGIEAVIDGSTASIALVEGGTASSISLIPTAPVILTAGANGELIIGSTASGGGFGPPNYSDNNPISVSFGTATTVGYDGWIVGYIAYDYDSYGCEYHIFIGTTDFVIGAGWSQNPDYFCYVPVCLPVPANQTFQLNSSAGDYLTLNQLYFVHTL